MFSAPISLNTKNLPPSLTFSKTRGTQSFHVVVLQRTRDKCMTTTNKHLTFLFLSTATKCTYKDLKRTCTAIVLLIKPLNMSKTLSDEIKRGVDGKGIECIRYLRVSFNIKEVSRAISKS